MSVAVVTGGSKGIGAALVEAFADRGVQVVTCARSWPAQPPRPGVRRLVGDLSTQAGIDALAAAIGAAAPVIDVIVHNAASSYRHDLGSGGALDPAALHAEVTVNLLAPIQLTDFLVANLRRSARPTVVMVTSVVALGGVPAVGVYGATKAALHAYTASLRSVLSPSGVRVVEFIPPLTDTEMAARVVGRRKLTPAQCAALLVDGLDRGRDLISAGSNRRLASLDGLVRRIIAARTR